MKSLFKLILVITVVITATSCFNKKQPNYQYFPDMYTSPSYETYGDYGFFKNGMEAQLPPAHTIPRGWKPYDYPDSNDGYQDAKANLKNPMPYTESNLNNGKQLYTIYCSVCHGDKGDGKGVLAVREKILGIPAYDDPGRNITGGSIYHVMYYGMNNMGSYASQTTEKERWQIEMYVIDLKHKLEGKPKREFVKDTSTNNEHFDKQIDPVIGRKAMVSREKK